MKARSFDLVPSGASEHGYGPRSTDVGKLARLCSTWRSTLGRCSAPCVHFWHGRCTGQSQDNSRTASRPPSETCSRPVRLWNPRPRASPLQNSRAARYQHRCCPEACAKGHAAGLQSGGQWYVIPNGAGQASDKGRTTGRTDRAATVTSGQRPDSLVESCRNR